MIRPLQPLVAGITLALVVAAVRALPFSHEEHATRVTLAEMPAVTALAARHEGEIVAIILWVRSGDIVYAHLEGGSPAAYRTYATYGLIAAANEHFADCRIIHLGGAAGLEPEERHGLAHFKRGFANREVTAYFCGSCLDVTRYATLIRDQSHTTFFPAYRKP